MTQAEALCPVRDEIECAGCAEWQSNTSWEVAGACQSKESWAWGSPRPGPARFSSLEDAHSDSCRALAHCRHFLKADAHGTVIKPWWIGRLGQRSVDGRYQSVEQRSSWHKSRPSRTARDVISSPLMTNTESIISPSIAGSKLAKFRLQINQREKFRAERSGQWRATKPANEAIIKVDTDVHHRPVLIMLKHHDTFKNSPPLHLDVHIVNHCLREVQHKAVWTTSRPRVVSGTSTILSHWSACTQDPEHLRTPVLDSALKHNLSTLFNSSS